MPTDSDSGGPAALVVDDNHSLCVLVQQMLSPHFEVDVASDPDEALEMARSRTYELIVLDIMLSHRMSGVDVLKQLRREAAYEEVPVVAITGYELGGEDRFLEEGFDAFLPKPFTRENLLEKVSIEPGEN